MFTFDLQLFGGLFRSGGGSTQVIEKPVTQQTAPIATASSVQQESATDSEKAAKKRFKENARGRRATVTGAGTNTAALSAAGTIAKTLLGEEQRKKTLGGA